MKKLTGLFFALAVSALALLPTPADAYTGVYFVCVDSCLQCWRSGPCPSSYCVELNSGCEETYGIACHCYSY